jgi:hypothetical protein
MIFCFCISASGADVSSSSSSGALPPTCDRQAPLRFHRLPTSAWGLCVPQLWWTAAGADRFPPAAGHPAIRTRRHPRRRSTPESRKPGSKRDRQDLASRPWHEAAPSFGGQRSPCGPARLRLALPDPRGPHHPRRQDRHALALMAIKASPSHSLIRGAQTCGNSSDNPRHIGKWGPFAASPPDWPPPSSDIQSLALSELFHGASGLRPAHARTAPSMGREPSRQSAQIRQRAAEPSPFWALRHPSRNAPQRAEMSSRHSAPYWLPPARRSAVAPPAAEQWP